MFCAWFVMMATVAGPLLDEVKTIDVANFGKKAKPQPVMEEARATLQTFYAPFNRDLANLLNDDRFLWESDV